MLLTSTSLKMMLLVSLSLTSHAAEALPPGYQQAAEERRIRKSPHMKEKIGKGRKFGITKIERVQRTSEIADIDGYQILDEYKVSAKTHGDRCWMTQQGYIERDFTVYAVLSKKAHERRTMGPINFGLMFEDRYVEDPDAGQSGSVNGGNTASNGARGTTKPELSLTFNERVGRAVELVKGQYPKAKLYEADGTADSPTSNPSGICHLRVVFTGGDNNTIIVTEKAVGVFGAPELLPYPWLEDVAIEWPVAMKLQKAQELKEAAGFTAPYGAVTLRNPLGPTKENPCFIFGGNPSRPYIFVDTVTGKVRGGN